MRSVVICGALIVAGCSGQLPAEEQTALAAIQAAFPSARIRTTIANQTPHGERVVCGYAYQRVRGVFAASPFVWRDGEVLGPPEIVRISRAELERLCGGAWLASTKLPWVRGPRPTGPLLEPPGT